MLRQLPPTIQRQVLDYLAQENFVAAKKIHDEWMSKNALEMVAMIYAKPSIRQSVLSSLST